MTNICSFSQHPAVQIPLVIPPGKGTCTYPPIDYEHPPDRIQRQMQEIGSNPGKQYPYPPHGQQSREKDVKRIPGAAQTSGIDERQGQRDLGKSYQPETNGPLPDNVGIRSEEAQKRSRHEQEN